MARIPEALRQAIARNIHACRVKRFGYHGGARKCAEAFGVSPQQWSPWERGARTPDEVRLRDIADFFGVSVETLRRDGGPDNAPPPSEPRPEKAPPPTPPQPPAPQPVYVPVFILLPTLPEPMQSLYQQITACLNPDPDPAAPPANPPGR